jgi:methylornithine synthase
MHVNTEDTFGGVSAAAIIDRLLAGQCVQRDDIIRLLQIRSEEERSLLFAAARRSRQRTFGDRIFLYGFLYFSTYCRNHCTFCHYRAGNVTLARYRKALLEIIQVAKEMEAAGVHLIDLTSGEDPRFLSTGAADGTSLVDIVGRIKAETALPVMLSPGVLGDGALAGVADVGNDWYALYQESHNRALFATLRSEQSYDARILAKQQARRRGMLVEEGVLLGVGERCADIADSLLWMQENKIDQVRAMTFVPSNSLKVFLEPAAPEEVVIAVMRLLMPESLIPASLDVEGVAGLAVRLEAGANVVTSIVLPDRGLAGVASPSLDIEDERRTVACIRPVLADCGLTPASAVDYREWLGARRSLAKPDISSAGGLA